MMVQGALNYKHRQSAYDKLCEDTLDLLHHSRMFRISLMMYLCKTEVRSRDAAAKTLIFPVISLQSILELDVKFQLIKQNLPFKLIQEVNPLKQVDV